MVTLYSSDTTKVEETPFGLLEASVIIIPLSIIGWFLDILLYTAIVVVSVIIFVKVLHYFSFLKY